uniref:Uncharacterized protein n=1 Tax=Rhizophora mucronata TaxID=61149 RepID=A0A2P2R0P9_RHIMU
MVFAPNMTQMSDPLTALMYAVQVMNFLKTLVIRMLREREYFVADATSVSHLEPSDENGPQSSSQRHLEEDKEAGNASNGEKEVVTEEPALESPPQSSQDDFTAESDPQNFLSSIENIPVGNRDLVDSCPCEVVSQVKALENEHQDIGSECRSTGIPMKTRKNRTNQLSNSNRKKGCRKANDQLEACAAGFTERTKGTGIGGRINPRMQRFEAWR